MINCLLILTSLKVVYISSLPKSTKISPSLQFVIQKSIKRSRRKDHFIQANTKMDKLKALRQKLKKGQDQKPQEKKEQLPVVELGYAYIPVESNNEIQQQQMQPQFQAQYVQHSQEVKQQNRLGYELKKQDLEEINVAEQVEREKHQPQVQEAQQKIPQIHSNQQNISAQFIPNQIKYGYQKAEEISPLNSNQQQQIPSQPIEKFEPVHQQKPIQPLPSSQLGYKEPQMTTPVKQQLPQVIVPLSAEDKKKSKMEMLREKIRLKKLAENQSLSNKSIPQQPKPHQTKPQNLGYKEIPQPSSSQPLNTNSYKPSNSFGYQQIPLPQQQPINNHHQNMPQNLGYKRIIQSSDYKQENNYGSKKPHIDPAGQAVLFQGMREDHIPIQSIAQNNNFLGYSPEQQPSRPIVPIEKLHPIEPQIAQNQINPQKPILSTQPHTLFYQLNQLQDYLKSSQGKNAQKNNGGIKEFVHQLTKLKENIQHFNNVL